MKVMCAPDKFKGSLTAAEAARAMAAGVRQAAPDAQPDAQVEICPVADGGEGTVEALAASLGQPHAVQSRVAGPLGEMHGAPWIWFGDETGKAAVIEMAAASGLQLVPPERRDPTRTSTLGTGQLIAAALDGGARQILLGIGGSATCDGGCGTAQALGVRFFNLSGAEIQQPITGGMLADIARIDIAARDSRLTETEVRVACDVTNPFTGPNGAAYVYGPQKGATPAQVQILDTGLRHLAEMIRRDLGRDIENLPGSGAAGGLGGGLVAFLGARLCRGIDLILEMVHFDERLRGCDLCLTGEGRLDGQTASGKTVMGVTHAAAAHGIPTIALVGCLGPGAEQTLAAGLSAYRLIGPGLRAEESQRRAAELLQAAAATTVSDFIAGRK